MKVKAIKQGYYDNKRVAEGQIFTLVPYKGLDRKYKTVKGPNGVEETVLDKEVEREFSPEEQFSPKWMEKLDGSEGSPEELLLRNAAQKPAKVQQAVDARDLEAMIKKVLGEQSISAQGGVQGQSAIGRVAPKKASKDAGEEAPKADADKDVI